MTAALDRLHALAWKIVIAGQDERGHLYPPLLGEYWRMQLVRDLALIIALLEVEVTS